MPTNELDLEGVRAPPAEEAEEEAVVAVDEDDEEEEAVREVDDGESAAAGAAGGFAAALPVREEWRLYRGFAAAIEERARASQGGRATEAGALARHVARRVMSARPPREIVYGHMTLLFAALAAAPGWARDAFFARRFGLHNKTATAAQAAHD